MCVGKSGKRQVEVRMGEVGGDGNMQYPPLIVETGEVKKRIRRG